jgi:hypothetical protein
VLLDGGLALAKVGACHRLKQCDALEGCGCEHSSSVNVHTLCGCPHSTLQPQAL